MNLLADVYRMRTRQGSGWMNLPVWDASTDSHATSEQTGLDLPTTFWAGLAGSAEAVIYK